MLYELESELLVVPLISPIIILYIIPCIKPLKGVQTLIHVGTCYKGFSLEYT